MIPSTLLDDLRQAIPHLEILTDNESLSMCAHDHTENLCFLPDLVVCPRQVEEISILVTWCNRHQIPITVRGAGTGLSGGALPIHGGIVLHMKYFDKILNIDIPNFQATIEPGVINETLQQAVLQHGLFYPPDPASKGSCTLGGNVAHASGGPRALKYGTTRDYILNLEVVLPTGEIIWTGANTLKYATGYNLTHLMIGSEGTLGIITKIVVKLIARPTLQKLILASFTSPEKACAAVSTLFLKGCQPSVCEFIEPEGFILSSAFTGLPFTHPAHIEAYLLIEADGIDNEQVMRDTEQMVDVLYAAGCDNILFAEDEAQKEYFWKLRRTIGESTKHDNVYKEEDTVVPRAYLPQLFAGVKKIAAAYQIRTICYGHAGDGNLHVNILKDNLPDNYWHQEVPKAIQEIFSLCKQLGGTISGEHGIGYVQQPFMSIVMSEKQLSLMRAIKEIFDPNQILNPGKICYHG